MPIIDIFIAVAILISVVVGAYRGLVKEAISFVALLVAIWAALYFGPAIGDISESWIDSKEAQKWFGRVIVFIVILSIGGVLGWGISKIVRLSLLGGIDRLLGALFGVVRGIVLVAVLILVGQFSEMDKNKWWRKSNTIPYLEVVADWIEVMAPQGYELLKPDEAAKKFKIDLTSDLNNNTNN